jgi:hypothetical protein
MATAVSAGRESAADNCVELEQFQGQKIKQGAQCAYREESSCLDEKSVMVGRLLPNALSPLLP